MPDAAHARKAFQENGKTGPARLAAKLKHLAGMLRPSMGSYVRDELLIEARSLEAALSANDPHWQA
jgi:hypothetical protein